MGQAMQLHLRQQLAISPQLQQSLRLLQMTASEFEQEVRAALDSNPFLEEGERPAPLTSAQREGAAAEPAPAPEPPPDDSAFDDGRLPPRAARQDAGDGQWTDWAEAPSTLRDHLRQQLLLSRMGERDRACAHLMVEALDDDGYLRLTFEELAALAPPEFGIEPDDLVFALRLVQTLDPAGVGARSLQECLLLQLQALPAETVGRALALALIGEHFALLAGREFARLPGLLGCNESQLHVARTLIRTLDPKPGLRFGPEDTRYVMPDVIVSKVAGQWVARINSTVLPRVQINRRYAELASAYAGAELSRQLQEARWLMRNLRRRVVTIQRVAGAIVAKQRSFFDHGDIAMKPLALKDVAVELGLHESTVCRATNGKYMATPHGLFEFKHFFSRELAAHRSGAFSPTAIRALLRDLVGAEKPGMPLSDADLARLLARQGVHVARRTVTKYRAGMRIPSVELRRAMAAQGAAG